MKSIKNFLAAAAVGSLIMAQPVAAATRSANSLPEAGAKVERLGSMKKKSEEAAGTGLIIPIAAVIAIIVGIIIIADDDDSPG